MPKDQHYKIELMLALILSVLFIIVYQRDVIFASNELYPSAYDFLGHMSKIEYISDSIKSGILPSWYPFWYSGAAVTQYYPPLSYYLLVPFYLISQSAMVTFKCFSFFSIFFAAMGVWYLCRLYIGKWCGLMGIAVICSNHFLQQITVELGQVAQGPVIALTPWYILNVMDAITTRSKKSWIISTILCALMILSHANTAFMICFCMMLAIFILLLFGKTNITAFILVCTSIVFSGMLTVFWSLIGVTGLENPGIPYLAEEAVAIHTASVEWFLNSSHQYYFSIITLLGSIYATFIYLGNKKKNSNNKSENYFIPFVILFMAISILFSFGEKIIFFKYIPMYRSIVAGRILMVTIFPASILWAYAVANNCFPLKNLILSNILKKLVCLIMIVLIIIDTSPMNIKRSFWGQEISSSKYLESEFSHVNTERDYLNKGRASFLGPYDGGMPYFLVKTGFAINEGYNIEGTLQNQYLRNQVTANVVAAYGYIEKNLTFHNVRYLILHPLFYEFINNQQDTVLFEKNNTENIIIEFEKKMPSSYTLLDKRNALIFGPGSAGIAIEFPYLVYEDRNNIYDFSLEELSRYKLIYISEPNIATIQHKKKIEEIIKELVKRDATVIIAPSVNQRHDLFGVMPQYYKAGKKGILYKNKDTQFSEENDTNEHVYFDGAYFLGLDESYYVAQQEGTMIENDVIGAKNVESGKVIFLGMNLSHHLKAVSTINWGFDKMETIFMDENYGKKEFFEDIFEYYEVVKDFYPEEFSAKGFGWDYDRIYFDYASEKSEEVTLSITYAPRWKAYVDGEQISVGQKENLMVFKLPKGDHSVELVYGTTIYGIIGYIISGISLLLLLLFMRNYGKIICLIDARIGRIKSMLEI